MSRMRPWLLASVAMAFIAGFGAAPAPAAAESFQYWCSLEGANEVPATTSRATGTFTATLDEAAQKVTWSLSVPSITNATLAHIHAGPAGVNGPPVVTLFSSVPAGSVTISGASGPPDIGGPYTDDWGGFVAALKAGEVYVNIHTTANPGGEIRGQILISGGSQATATATSSARSTVTPAAPKTGQAGLFDEVSGGTGLVAGGLLVVAAVAVVAGGRVLSRRLR
jgi:hypothetical protein